MAIGLYTKKGIYNVVIHVCDNFDREKYLSSDFMADSYHVQIAVSPIFSKEGIND